MQPIGLLMIEHRLIERMIALMEKELVSIDKGNEIRLLFIEAVVDFIQTYADQTHHGKEETILFRALSDKNLSDIDRNIMAELIHDHTIGRATAAKLVVALHEYQKTDINSLALIVDNVKTFVNFYPGHIEKEDNVFFPAIGKYFSKAEQDTMLERFREYDMSLIHDKYKRIVESFEV